MQIAKVSRQPYIKVRYKVDYPVAGIKKGDVIAIAHRTWATVPLATKEITELVEGPETLQELKTNELESYKEMYTKAVEDLEEGDEEDEEEDESKEGDDEHKPKPRKKVGKKKK